MLRRRDLLRTGLLGTGALALGPSFWSEALASAPATPGSGPYGPLLPPDENGLMLPEGFRSRIVARGHALVEGTTYVWHQLSDGQATFPTDDGGFILVSNSEVATLAGGGASAIRFANDGRVRDAYRILEGTTNNCAGGGTPWGTWLSCEETVDGRVWECDPTGQQAAIVRPAMGVFSHEAVAVDPGGKRLYLTEDDGDGGFYRFTPGRYPDLSSGVLEIARVGAGGATTNGGSVTWMRVPDPTAGAGPTRRQLPNATRFKRGEGIWFDSGIVYVATTSDHRIYAYDAAAETIEVLYDGEALAAAGRETPLRDVDNITVSRQSGDLFVCEDDGGDDPLDIAIVTREREVARFLKVTGPQHGVAGSEAMSELAGVIFDPSGTRMYFASQRAFGVGVIYEVTGPFRRDRPAGRRSPGSIVKALRAPASLSIRSLRRRGLTVTVDLKRSARLNVGLIASIGRSRRLTLARSRPSGRRGEQRVRLELTPAGRRYLSGRRRVRARVRLTAIAADGTRETAVRRVVLSGPRSRRGRR